MSQFLYKKVNFELFFHSIYAKLVVVIYFIIFTDTFYMTGDTFRIFILVITNYCQGGRGQWVVYYTSAQSL